MEQLTITLSKDHLSSLIQGKKLLYIFNKKIQVVIAPENEGILINCNDWNYIKNLCSASIHVSMDAEIKELFQKIENRYKDKCKNDNFHSHVGTEVD